LAPVSGDRKVPLHCRVSDNWWIMD
jgi:hypothetical protein